MSSMLTVNEIYLSIQGESTHVGRPCTFVRLTACDLRCSWCDTPYAFTGGRKMAVEDVVAEVTRLGCKLVEMTGGEPMLQADVYPLMETLIQQGHEVLVETGGHVPLTKLPKRVKAIIDVKCPGSGESGKMYWPNLKTLKPVDEVKFVIKDRADFDYAVEVVTNHRLTERAAAVLFSPVFGAMAPDELAKWILESGLPVRLQLQAHKYIWRPDARGV
jgi:7-carboxy-7-deazaguanine synthase